MNLDKMCCICESADAKYKCPACRSPYCSVACCKSHKEGDSCKPTTPENSGVRCEVNTTPTYLHSTDNTIPPEKLGLLSDSKKLKTILENPHLQTILKHLNSARNPKEAMDEAMQEPLFVEFADACLNIVDPSE